MSLHATLIYAALALAAQHPTMPRGMSHDEHLEQMKKDEALKQRGADAMGFDQDATTHQFELAATGGSIEVTARDNAEAEVIAQVRSHLQAIAREFAHGDFGKPIETHAELPPGVSLMQKYAPFIQYQYAPLPRGGVVRIRTADVEALRAVHEFLRYQMKEHRTVGPSGGKLLHSCRRQPYRSI